MASEQREIRPFGAAASFDDCLGNLKLRMGGTTVDPTGRISVQAPSFMADAATLVLGVDAEAVSETIGRIEHALAVADLAATDVELLVIASTPRLKTSEIVRRVPAAELSGEGIDIARGQERPVAFQAPFGGCVVEVYLALSAQQDPAPLRPWRRGTWLARCRFTVATGFGEIGFTPIPLDDELRDKLDLPLGTIRYADLDSPLGSATAAESLRLYVDAGVLAALTDVPYTAASKMVQLQLFLDVVTAVLMHEDVRSSQRALRYDEIEDSVLARLVDRVAGVSPGNAAESGELRSHRDQVLRWAFEEPGQFMAHAENALTGLRKHWTNALSEAG